MSRADSETEPDHPVVLFDGVCNLCDRSVRFILRRDPHACFRFAPLQSEAARRLLARHGLQTGELDTMVLVDADGAHTRSEAAVRITRRLRGPARLLALLRAIPRPLRDWLYDRVARRRYRWFGRKDACLVPEDRWADRFLGEG